MQRGQVVGVLAVAATCTAVPVAQGPAKIDFRRDVQPIFQQHCISCHGPSQQMNGLRLDRRKDAMRPGGSGTVIGPGNSAGSRLYLKLTGSNYGAQMPPTGPLSPAEIDTVKVWIDQGAEWPDEASGEKPETRPDPKAIRIMQALRAGDRQTFERLVSEDPNAGTAKGPGGTTALMFAALYGDVASIRLLLNRGADPNARNDAGATALMWAVDDIGKVRALLDARGTDVNARSDDGLTALDVAARLGSIDVIELLLERYTKPGAPAAAATLPASLFGSLQPSEANLGSLAKLGIDPGSLPAGVLNSAIVSDCVPCVDLLSRSAALNRLNGALLTAARFGKAEATKILLDRGANPNTRGTDGLTRGLTPLMLAAASELAPTDVVKMLIERGADLLAESLSGQRSLDLAKRQGRTAVVDLLIERGATEASSSAPSISTPKPAASVRLAVERSIPLLQRADVTFLRKSGCVSCHNNSLTGMTMATVRRHRIAIDEKTATEQATNIGGYLEANREGYLLGDSVPGGDYTTAYILSGLAAEQYKPDFATDAAVRFLKNRQAPDGRWRNRNTRPPLESSDIEVTANAIRALRAYFPPSRRAEYDRAVQRGAEWLATAQPKTTEDRVFQLLGLMWARGDRAVLSKFAQELIRQQRSDGGWAQLPTLSSDAYGTGQALTALNQAAGLSPSDSRYQRGIAFLLKTQFEDGSWHVKSRSLPLQPYFESDFPWGHDQFISAAATNWAVMALAPAVR